MTLEELVACDNAAQKMQTVSAAVEELLVAAQLQDRLTVGVYESAKLMNVDPDSVVLCLLAIDEEEEDDIALQIHFTLIQSFCCENDIDIVRVSGMQRLAQLLGEPAETQGTTEARDLHCLLVTQLKDRFITKPGRRAAAVTGGAGANPRFWAHEDAPLGGWLQPLPVQPPPQPSSREVKGPPVTTQRGELTGITETDYGNRMYKKDGTLNTCWLAQPPHHHFA
ncbi:hypothetical protein E5288_WYG002594 [Bos mutus]|uniref:Ribosomal protein eL8/eL30/eS12/Gadd45 domain-containing protein n=1 Tax=Bos mutus TaxID=72004 RepID=A0A6B0R104_9CETA|nr:hypothetical protein [Bos mutus]